VAGVRFITIERAGTREQNGGGESPGPRGTVNVAASEMPAFALGKLRSSTRYG